MDDDRARQWFAAQRVARLATVRPDGAPHLVPVTFAVHDDTVYTAVDAKPKRTRDLQRIANLRHEPRCTLLADHYEDEWSRLWWVRVDGRAVVHDDPGTVEPGLSALARKYPQYAEARPAGPIIAVHVTRWTGWSAA